MPRSTPRSDRRVIVTDKENFPTDRYVFEGLAAQRGLVLRMVESDPVDGLTAEAAADAIDDDVALVSFSHVAYASGAIADMGPITEAAHRAGALALWDLSHTVGSFPAELDANDVDLAVGCTYKYVNGGPGAPAFLYVSQACQPELRQPIWGWFGQREQFEMGPAYDPVRDVTQFLVGTPPVLGLVAVDEGVKLLAEASIHAFREKGLALTSYLIDLHDDWLAPLGFQVGSPRDAAHRGSHVSLRHPDARALCPALISHGVIPDFRTPDRASLRPRADHDALRRRMGRDGLLAEDCQSVGLVPVRDALAVLPSVPCPAAQVSHDAEDHEEPAPPGDPDARRVRECVDQRRPRHDQQPEERDDERVVGTIDEVGEDPDEPERESWRDHRSEKDEAAHRGRLRPGGPGAYADPRGGHRTAA